MYMQEADLKNRPDALLVASKLAYADYVDFQMPQAQQTVKTLKRQNKKLQKQTLIEGGGVAGDQSRKDAYQKAKERQAQSGSKKDTQEAVRKYFAKINVLKE